MAVAGDKAVAGRGRGKARHSGRGVELSLRPATKADLFAAMGVRNLILIIKGVSTAPIYLPHKVGAQGALQ